MDNAPAQPVARRSAVKAVGKLAAIPAAYGVTGFFVYAHDHASWWYGLLWHRPVARAALLTFMTYWVFIAIAMNTLGS